VSFADHFVIKAKLTQRQIHGDASAFMFAACGPTGFTSTDVRAGCELASPPALCLDSGRGTR
jgi:hypothetical protein